MNGWMADGRRLLSVVCVMLVLGGCNESFAPGPSGPRSGSGTASDPHNVFTAIVTVDDKEIPYSFSVDTVRATYSLQRDQTILSFSDTFSVVDSSGAEQELFIMITMVVPGTRAGQYVWADMSGLYNPFVVVQVLASFNGIHFTSRSGTTVFTTFNMVDAVLAGSFSGVMGSEFLNTNMTGIQVVGNFVALLQQE